jgi:hypothetical protein
MFFLLVFGAVAANAQSPAPDPDTLQNPVKQIDPEVKQLPANLNYTKDATRISPDDLPPVVLDSVKRLHPTGWEKSVVYHHKKTNSYIIDIREEGGQKIYRFDKTGKRLNNEETDEKD